MLTTTASIRDKQSVKKKVNFTPESHTWKTGLSFHSNFGQEEKQVESNVNESRHVMLYKGDVQLQRKSLLSLHRPFILAMPVLSEQ